MNLPVLMDSCKCTIGISLDPQAFDCPVETPQPNRRAQEVLHGFEYLQCMSPTATEGKQQVRQSASLTDHAFNVRMSFCGRLPLVPNWYSLRMLLDALLRSVSYAHGD